MIAHPETRHCVKELNDVSGQVFRIFGKNYLHEKGFTL
jgi:hypothetical protein